MLNEPLYEITAHKSKVAESFQSSDAAVGLRAQGVLAERPKGVLADLPKGYGGITRGPDYFYGGVMVVPGRGST